MTLEALAQALDELADEDLSDSGAVMALHKELSRFEAMMTRAVGGLDASREWEVSGARACASYIAHETGYPLAECRHRVRLARGLRKLPVLEQALAAGAVSPAAAGVLCRTSNPRTEKALERDEEMLVSQAATLSFEDFVRAVSYWDQLADQDGADEKEEQRRARRDVSLGESFAGMWLGKMTLDPISGEIVKNELERLEQELFEADWKSAKDTRGREPSASELPRTAAQRRADALVEMAMRSKTVPADGRRPAPLFSVFVGYETLRGRICELSSGSVVVPAALDGWLDVATFERAVFGPGNRVEISRRSRLFKGATRRAIELRDRVCAHPYCNLPISRCQADHILPYAEGGETTQDNGRLLCGFHNRLRTKGWLPPPQ